MRLRACMATLVALVTIVPPAPSGAAGGYLPAISGEDGMVFPVARSRWFSIINFRNDWHAPRFRFVEGQGWQLIGRHEGNDVFAEPGTPVRAMLGGTVEQIGWTFYSGWRVGVRGSDGRYWFYAHLRALPGGLSVGEPVAAGQRIGRVGNTGYGPDPGHKDEFVHHLHLGIQEADGTWVNPYPLLKDLYAEAVRATR